MPRILTLQSRKDDVGGLGECAGVEFFDQLRSVGVADFFHIVKFAFQYGSGAIMVHHQLIIGLKVHLVEIAVAVRSCC